LATSSQAYDPTPALSKDDDADSLASVASTIFESEIETSTLTRVEDLWFEEDNLIIRAEDSLICVSKGVLAARSPVLKALLFEAPAGPKMLSAHFWSCRGVRCAFLEGDF
jgi:hypothetical protein